jgi:hypothetical protein
VAEVDRAAGRLVDIIPHSMPGGGIVHAAFSAVIRYRMENTRIISGRRSRPEVVALYEGQEI